MLEAVVSKGQEAVCELIQQNTANVLELLSKPDKTTSDIARKLLEVDFCRALHLG
jgi:hypothetical protein